MNVSIGHRYASVPGQTLMHQSCQHDQGIVQGKQWCKTCCLQRTMLGLKIEPMGNSNEPWEKKCFSNGNYAGDPVSRQSISNFILYVLGIPVSWRSKSKKSVSLSTSGAEYIALSEAVKGVIFVAQLLKSIQIVVKYLVTVRVNNVGAIFMASYIMTTSQTKHVDIWYEYVNEYVKDGIVKIIFVVC